MRSKGVETDIVRRPERSSIQLFLLAINAYYLLFSLYNQALGHPFGLAIVDLS
jgi:hypothetical protein